jgi:4-hydroxythreonine-4-phosphate dehydrogenase
MASASALPLAITMGDAAGIGPEVVARLFKDGAGQGAFVVGDVAVMRNAATIVGGLLPVARLEHPGQLADVPPDCLPVLQVEGLPPDLLAAPLGRVDARCGRAAAASIERAVRLVQQGQAGAIVTAPIHKEALAAAGVPYPGHTEMLQALAAGNGVPPPVRMMLANDELRTVLVTIHMSLKKAIDAITFDAVLETIRIAHAAAVRQGLARPRIAVAGLNPHAGEGRAFGDEDDTCIAPAIARAREQGLQVSGPHPPDTVFLDMVQGRIDAVVCMYHDQGHIPMKLLDFRGGVNVTLGLPIVRTSVDHGTAFDIAWKGIAFTDSLRDACAMARRLSRE